MSNEILRGARNGTFTSLLHVRISPFARHLKFNFRTEIISAVLAMTAFFFLAPSHRSQCFLARLLQLNVCSSKRGITPKRLNFWCLIHIITSITSEWIMEQRREILNYMFSCELRGRKTEWNKSSKLFELIDKWFYQFIEAADFSPIRRLARQSSRYRGSRSRVCCFAKQTSRS